jgi:hypothetical protein
MSPIAPSRVSFEDVPSSWIATPSDHSRKRGANRPFVTRWMSSIPAARIFSTIQSTIGRPPTGSSCFGTSSVSGLSRVA